MESKPDEVSDDSGSIYTQEAFSQFLNSPEYQKQKEIANQDRGKVQRNLFSVQPAAAGNTASPGMSCFSMITHYDTDNLQLQQERYLNRRRTFPRTMMRVKFKLKF